MLEAQTLARVGRNVILYLIGVGFATAGALGLAGAISLNIWLSAAGFVLGLGLVIAVHEIFHGPA